jgi:DNA polymerase
VSQLSDLYARIAACTTCGLCKTRTLAVPGEGPDDAEIMFVGEGPGFHEDQQGRPFVGQAGKFLEEMLASIGLRRSDVYITNVVKCRPPGNRDPLPNEIEACRPYLEEQIRRIQPRVIVTLGRYSLAWFFPRDTISRVHGQIREKDGRVFVNLYHPAAALHSAGLRKTIEEDFRRIPAALERARALSAPAFVLSAPAGEAAPQPAAEQMRLF